MATLADRRAVLREAGLTPLLKQAEVQAYFGISDWTVNQWVRSGCPVEPTPFRGRRFDLERVKTWISETADAADAA